ncbi:hypothetical protein [Glaciihabitans sp. dw_435]|uniref:hypothetical protein n=1 Tax=Glaciihabitans sp. dw_435 TaxID=2720081 RepID=UPI001BD63DB3|nr:hypothetical protein [Glaciihabitans sp. dw_435]
MSLRINTSRRPGGARLITRSFALLAVVALASTTGVLGAAATTSFPTTGVARASVQPTSTVSGYFDAVDDEEESDLIAGPFTGPTNVQVSIYALTDGVVSSVPVQAFPSGDSFEFDELAPGDYAIAFRDGDTHAWVPALYNNLSPQVGSMFPGGSVAGDGCLVPLTLTRGHDIDLGFFRLGDTAKSVCTAPWGTGASFSGSVTGWAKGNATEVGLYYATAADTAVEVDRSALSSTGTYSFPSVTRAGRYFVAVTAGETAPYFDTAQGGYPYDQYEWAYGSFGEPSDLEQAVAHAPLLADSVASPGNDVTLIGAVIARGTVTAGTKPLADAEVSAYHGKVDQSARESAYTDKSGHYAVKIHPGAKLTLGAAKSGFYTRFFPNTENEAKATPVDFLIPGFDKRAFNFSLRPTVTSLIGTVSPYPLNTLVAGGDPDPLKGMTATLYRKSGASWKKIGSSPSALVPAEGYRIGFPLAGSTLAAGDYHLRFSIGSRWLPITGYRSDDDYTTVDGPMCSVPVTLKAGTPKVMTVAVDFYRDTTATCTDESTPASTVGAGSSGSGTGSASGVGATGDGGPVDSSLLTDVGATGAGTVVMTPSPGAGSTPTPTDAATGAPVPSPSLSAAGPETAAPVVASATGGLSWIILAGGIVLAVILAGLIVMVVRRQASAGR